MVVAARGGGGGGGQGREDPGDPPCLAWLTDLLDHPLFHAESLAPLDVYAGSQRCTSTTGDHLVDGHGGGWYAGPPLGRLANDHGGGWYLGWADADGTS